MSRFHFFCVALTLLGCLAVPSAAQVPPVPEDTLIPTERRRPPAPPRADTARPAVPDSMAPAAQDSAAPEPPPRFGALYAEAAPGLARTQFLWRRDDLRRELAVTLADLLEQVPGMQALRAGLFQQPEAATAFGHTQGRLEIVVDGFVLDPFTTSTFDLSALELAQIEEVRVERRLDLTRVHVATLEPVDSVPYSRIEAATGEPDGNVLRAVFTAPYVIRGPLALGIDRIDSDGRNGEEEADLFSLWAKWGWFPRPGRAVQVEWRQARLRRLEGVPWAADEGRRDLIVRARNRFSDAFTAELFIGHTAVENTAVTTSTADTVRAVERSSWQAGARAALRTGGAWFDAEARLRDRDALPLRQLDLSGGVQPLPFVRLGGSFTSAGWSHGGSASSYDLRAELGTEAVGVFGELAGGTRGAPVYLDSLGHDPVETHALTDRSGQRLGAFARLLGIDATAALVRMSGDSARGFGLPFDRTYPATPLDDATGFEAFGRVPLWPRFGLSAVGSYTYWNELPGWLYLPGRSWRVAAELHTFPLPSRNLEIFGRLEHLRRGSMLVPVPGFVPGDTLNPSPNGALPARSLLNGYLQIRVIDVRAFIQWYDLLGDFREDVPGRIVRGPRILYGVKWQLFN